MLGHKHPRAYGEFRDSTYYYSREITSLRLRVAIRTGYMREPASLDIVTIGDQHGHEVVTRLCVSRG